jgi:hypothetical protein
VQGEFSTVRPVEWQRTGWIGIDILDWPKILVVSSVGLTGE